VSGVLRSLFTRRSAFWWSCALAAPPLAVAIACAGYGIARIHPARDIALLALGAVAEELVFRGGVQAALRARLPAQAFGLSVANIGASTLFALAHLWAHPPLVALGVLPVSLVLGAAYERSGHRLAAPMALHLYFNLLLYAASVGCGPW
jgi:membrane protease YdiL (CAAX protease family)